MAGTDPLAASAPTDQLDGEVQHTGFLRTDTTNTLTATVEGLRADNTLVVWSYKGTANVKAKREYWLIPAGTQELIVPAVVSYELDLSKLTLDKVTFNENAKKT